MQIKFQPPQALIQFLASAAYSGYLPWFPGTWASLLTASMVFCFWRLTPDLFFLGMVFSVLIVIGIWSATWYDRLFRTHDASAIVIDEVAGQFLALWPLLVLRETGLGWYTVAVVLFRFFDIKKPCGIYRLQTLPEGLGVMADDLLAGAYAALLIVGGLWIKTLL